MPKTKISRPVHPLTGVSASVSPASHTRPSLAPPRGKAIGDEWLHLALGRPGTHAF